MINKVPLAELNLRMVKFRKAMDKAYPEWKLSVIFSKINLYYLTGTMQEGMLIIQRDRDAEFWVRRSFERALDESLFPIIKAMESFRDAVSSVAKIPEQIYLETEVIPVAFLKRFQKHFPVSNIQSLDYQISGIRSVKSSYELDIMTRSGSCHRQLLEEVVPNMLFEGMSEADLAGKLYEQMLHLGHHGVARLGMFDTEMGIGHIAFGESSLYPTSFNGPGGNYGMSPAVQFIGSRDRRLTPGDLVFIDIGFGVDGYHTDKTLNYIFRGQPDAKMTEEHNRCLELQDMLAGQLVPGNIPSMLYEETIAKLSPAFLKDFMGFGNRQVKFLGHGIGLVIDEIPVIAKGFDEPLVENMVIALEPKKGIAGKGMVGIENTFIVTPQGGKCITGLSRGLVPVV